MDSLVPVTKFIRIYQDDLLFAIRSNNVQLVNSLLLLPVQSLWPLDIPGIQFDSASDSVLQLSSEFQIFGPFSHEMTVTLQEELAYRQVVASLQKLAKEYSGTDDLVADVCASLQTLKNYAESGLCKNALSQFCFNLVYFSIIAEKYENLLKNCVTVARAVFKEIEVPLTKLLLPLVEFSRFQSLVNQFRQLKWKLLNDNETPLRPWDDLQRQFSKLEEIKRFFGTYHFGRVQLNLVEALHGAFTRLRSKMKNIQTAQTSAANSKVGSCDLYAVLKDIGTMDRILFYVDAALSLDIDANNSDLRVEKLVIERALQVVGECTKTTDDTPHLTPKGQSLLHRAGVPIQTVTNLRNLLSHCSTLLACSQTNYCDIDSELLESVQHDLDKIKQVISKRLRKLELEQVKMLLLEIRLDDITLGTCASTLAEISDLLKQIESSSSLKTLKELALQISRITAERNEFRAIKESIDEVLFLMQVKDASVDMKASQKAIKQPLQNFLQTIDERQLGFFEKSDVKSSITAISNARGIEDFYVSKYKIDPCPRNKDAPELFDTFVAEITEKLFEDQNYKKVKKKLKYVFDAELDVAFLKAAVDSTYAEILNVLHANPLLTEPKVNYLLNSFLKGTIPGDEIFRLFGLDQKQKGQFQSILQEFRQNITRNVRSKEILVEIVQSVMAVCKEQLRVAEFKKLDEEIQSQTASHSAKEKLTCFCGGIRAVDENEFHNLATKVRTHGQVNAQNWYRLNRQRCKSQIMRVKDPYGDLLSVISREKGFLDTMESVQKFVNALNADSNCSPFLTRAFAVEIEKYFEEQYKGSIELLKTLSATVKLGEAVNDSKLNIALEMAVLNSMSTLKEISNKKVFHKLEKLTQATIAHLSSQESGEANTSLRNYLAHGNSLGDVLKSNVAQTVHLAAEVFARHGLTILEIKKLLTDTDTNSFVKHWVQGRNQDLGTYIPCKHKRQIEIIKETEFWKNGSLKQVLVTLIMSDDGPKDGYDGQKFDLEIQRKLIESEFVNAVCLDNLEMAEFCIRRGALYRIDGNVECAMHFAAENGSTEIMHLLLNRGFTVNSRCQGENKPLHVAVYAGQGQAVQVLLKSGADENAADMNGYTALHAAARTGNANIMKHLIQNGAKIDKLSRVSKTPLQLAAWNGHSDAVEMLLESGAEVDLSDQQFITPLLYAAYEGHDRIVAFLLANGASVNGNVKLKCTPLWAAIMRRHDDVAKLLIDNGADVNSRDNKSETPLHHTCYYNRAEICQILVNRGASLNAVNGFSFSPLHIAAILGNVAIAQVLLQGKTRIDDVDKYGRVALHFAAEKGHLDFAELLIEKGTNVNAASKTEVTPLHLAVVQEDLPMTRFLLQNGANVDAVYTNHRKSPECLDQPMEVTMHWPLQYAVIHGHATLVELLLEFGADTGQVDHCNNSVLHLAAYYGHSEILPGLLKNGANINALNSPSNTPLQYCFQQGHHRVAKILLQNGAALDIVPPEGQPLVHSASKLGNCDMIKLLIENGADIYVMNRQGVNALQCAVLYGQLEVIEFLLEIGYDINATGKHAKTALHWACELESSEDEQIGDGDLDRNTILRTVRILLENKADVNAKDLVGKIALHYSAKIGDIDVVRLLLEHNADITAIDSLGDSPVQIAQQYNRTECCEYLIAKGADNNPKLYPNSENEDLAKNPVSVIDPCNSDEPQDWVKQLTNAVSESNTYLVKRIVNDNMGKDLNKYNLLHIAVANGDIPVIGLLLESGMDVNYLDSQECIAPLHLAVRFGYLNVIKFLLDNGADINVPTRNHEQLVIHWAAINGDIHVLRLILENDKIAVDAMDAKNETPLFLACQAGHTKIVQELLGKGASVHSANKDGDFPIHVAILYNCIPIVVALLDHGADPRAPGKDGNTPLHYSMMSGSMSTAQKLLAHDAPVDSVNTANHTPLHVAVLNGRQSLVEFLLDQGASVHSAIDGTDSPLHLAVEKGLSELSRILLQRQCNVNAKNGKQQTPLHVAAFNGHYGIGEMLLQHGALIDPPDEIGCTPLLLAVEQCDYGITCLLLEKGADCNSTCHENWSVLHKAVHTSDTSILQKLLEQGADTDIFGKNGWTPLHLAVVNGCTNSVNLLVDKGAEVNSADNDRNTPILIACQHEHEDLLKTLIAAGGDVNIRDKEGNTPLFLVTKKNNVNAMQILLDNGSDINATNQDLTALHIAICTGCYTFDTDAAKVLLQHGADVNWIGDQRLTFIHWACLFDNADIIETLISYGLSVNARMVNDVTPLHTASHQGHVQSMQVLLECGADINALNTATHTPMHDAIRNKHTSAAKLLLRHGANVLMMLHYACESGHDDIIESLLDHGLLIEDTNLLGQTPLHVACMHGHAIAASKLITLGANANVLDCSQCTPLHYACSGGHVEVVQVLLNNSRSSTILDIDATNKDRLTPLAIAITNKLDDIAIALIAKGARVNFANVNGDTPLMLAIRHHRFAVARTLINNGADVNVTNDTSHVALHEAILADSVPIIQELLQNGAHLDTLLENGCTLLHYASCIGNAAMARLLLDLGQNVHAANHQGQTPLHLASIQGFADVASTLLASGANVNATDNASRTPLQLLTYRAVLHTSRCVDKDLLESKQEEYVQTAKILFSKGANINAIDEMKITALHIAASDGFVALVQLLLDSGADVTGVTSENEYTPLHYAAEHGHLKVVQMLLNKGAVIDQKTSTGATALSKAAFGGHLEMVKVLLENNACAHIQDSHSTILHAATHSGNPMIIKLILDKLQTDLQLDHNLDAPDSDGDTPLMWAAECGHLEAAKILLQYGANKSAKNNSMNTAMDWATKNGHTEIVNLLQKH